MTKQVHIVDHEFGHAQGICCKYVPGPIEWVRGCTDHVPLRFFTDRCLEQVTTLKADVNVAMLIEPAIGGWERYYAQARALADRFDYILTFDWEFKNSLPKNGLLFQMGCCWIDSELRWKRCDTKTELVSIIASDKTASTGQGLRHVVAHRFPAVHRYGHRALAHDPQGGWRNLDEKADALKRYAFSIVIENCALADWFTDKPVDAFACGTVPIYWGSPVIGDTFNKDGIITFKNLEDLEQILKTLSFDLWRSKLGAIRDNRERAEQHLSPEWGLVKRYPFLFP